MVNKIIIDGCVFNIIHNDIDINKDITIRTDKNEINVLKELASKFKVVVIIIRNNDLMFQDKAFLYIKEINLKKKKSTIIISKTII